MSFGKHFHPSLFFAGKTTLKMINFARMTLTRTTLVIMTLTRVALIITTLDILTFSRTTVARMTLSLILVILGLDINTLSIIKLSVITSKPFCARIILGQELGSARLDHCFKE